ncbi:hypothetical protein J5H79_18695, partial [Providencia rettgeri]|nr:hypothetical protein [Providencia rettgeri]
IEYLHNNPEIIGAQTYTEQLSSVKMAIDKTPIVLKNKLNTYIIIQRLLEHKPTPNNYLQ